MAGAFPTSPTNLDLHTTNGGTTYQYLDDPSPRWVLYKTDISAEFLLIDNLENPPTENESEKAPTSEWAYDNQFITLMNAIPTSNSNYHGTVMQISTSGCTNYQLVYISGFNQVSPSNAGDESTMPVVGMVVGSGLVLTHGVVRNDSWTLVANKRYYAETSAGAMIAEPNYPNATDDIVQFVGESVGEDEFFVNPSPSWVKHI